MKIWPGATGLIQSADHLPPLEVHHTNHCGVAKFQEDGWYAYTAHTLAGNFKTKEDAEMALLEMMLSEKDI